MRGIPARLPAGRCPRSGEGCGNPVRRRPVPVQTGAERGEDLRHITDQVIVKLGRIHYHQASAGGGKGGFDQFGVHPPESVPVFDHDRRGIRIPEQLQQLRPRPVHPRTDL